MGVVRWKVERSKVWPIMKICGCWREKRLKIFSQLHNLSCLLDPSVMDALLNINFAVLNCKNAMMLEGRSVSIFYMKT